MKDWSGKMKRAKQAAYFKSSRKEENGEFPENVGKSDKLFVKIKTTKKQVRGQVGLLSTNQTEPNQFSSLTGNRLCGQRKTCQMSLLL